MYLDDLHKTDHGANLQQLDRKAHDRHYLTHFYSQDSAPFCIPLETLLSSEAKCLSVATDLSLFKTMESKEVKGPFKRSENIHVGRKKVIQGF